jgi:hypothetical protein
LLRNDHLEVIAPVASSSWPDWWLQSGSGWLQATASPGSHCSGGFLFMAGLVAAIWKRVAAGHRKVFGIVVFFLMKKDGFPPTDFSLNF